MNAVFVLSNTKTPLMPTSPRRARLLLSGGKAAVFRRYPFTECRRKAPGFSLWGYKATVLT